MSTVTYIDKNDNNAGAIPEGTQVKTTSTASGEVQHVNIDAMGASGLLHYFSELAMGNIAGRTKVNKFGAAPLGVQTTDTDIWDRADATPTQSIWIAPTQARVHAVVSSSSDDIDGGLGAYSVIVYGLTDWGTAEVNETVTMSGATPINTINSYVIIHRMKCVGGANTTNIGVNAGTITATAAVDGTVTAVILPGNGQTEMAIYGVPSVQTALLYRWSAQIDQASAQARTVDFQVRVNENPDVQLSGFLRKDDISVQSNGTSSRERNFTIPPKFPGPCIIKISATGSANDLDAEAEFDLELVTN